jgi:hypothetical protein
MDIEALRALVRRKLADGSLPMGGEVAEEEAG